MESFTCDKFQFSLGLYLEYTLRFLGLIFRDSLRFVGTFCNLKWQVPTSLKCDLPPRSIAKKTQVLQEMLQSHAHLIQLYIYLTS